MNQEKIGKFIKEERKNKKLSQEELGELLGVSNRSISKWETGVSLPDISLFKPLCEVLDISYNELLSGERLNKTNYQERLEDNLSNVISYASKKDNKFNGALILLMVLSTFLSIYFINVNNKVWIPLSFIAIIILIYILRNNIIKYSLMLFEKIKNNTYIFNDKQISFSSKGLQRGVHSKICTGINNIIYSQQIKRNNPANKIIPFKSLFIKNPSYSTFL